jgi:hypothetical protein
LPVPEQWVLPSEDPIPGGEGVVIQPATFAVDFDDVRNGLLDRKSKLKIPPTTQDIGSSDPSQIGAGTSGEVDDGLENDSAVRFIFRLFEPCSPYSSSAKYSFLRQIRVPSALLPWHQIG